MVPDRANLAVAALGVAAAVAVSCAQPQGESSVAASVDTLMTDLHERGLFNGAIVVGSGDDILYERGFGLANVDEGVPFTPDTPSNGASMGKTLTNAAILMLEEEGLIDLDDPVTKYLPEFPYPEVTVRHLITHSSGLHPDGPYFMFLPPDVERQTNDRLLEILVEHTPPLAFPSGSAFEYSGTGFIMAAILMERVTGTSYASFLQERIFDPLEMDSSFVPPVGDSDWPGVRTLGYRRTDGGKIEIFEDPDNRQTYGQGRLYYSARDLYRWVTSFYSNPVLSESTLQAGLEPPVLGGEHPSGLNLLNWYYPETGRRFYFTGDNRGHYTFAYWDADRRHAFVYMSNTLLPSWLKPTLAIALIEILEGRRPAPMEAPEYIELAPSIFDEMPSLADFAPILGVYDTDSAGRVSIEHPPPDWMNIDWALDDGWFAPVARVNDGLRYNMFPVDNGMLYVPGLNAWVGFTEGDDGPTIHWTTVFEGMSTGHASALARVEALDLDTAKVGRVAVYFRAADREHAERLAALCEEAAAYFEGALGSSFPLHLAVLDPEDWFDPGRDDARSYGEPWARVQDLLMGVPASLDEGVLILGPDDDADSRRVRFVMLHELGHLANKRYLHPESPRPYSSVKWFEEFLATYFAYAFVRSHDSEWAEASHGEWVDFVEGYTPPVLSLDWTFMREIPPEEKGLTYAWYQILLNLRAAAVYEEHGLDFLRQVKDRMAWDGAGEWTTESVLSTLEGFAPGFEAWAKDLEKGDVEQ